MLEEVHVIVWVEERLDSISTVDGSVRTLFAECAKNCEQQSFAGVNQSSFLRFLQIVFKRKFKGC